MLSLFWRLETSLLTYKFTFDTNNSHFSVSLWYFLHCAWCFANNYDTPDKTLFQDTTWWTFPSHIAKLVWPRFGPHPPFSTIPGWNDNTSNHSNTGCQPKVARVCFVLSGPYSPFTLMGPFRFKFKLHLTTACLPKKKKKSSHVLWYMRTSFHKWAHIHFIWAIRRPEMPHHRLKWPPSVCCLGFELILIQITLNSIRVVCEIKS